MMNQNNKQWRVLNTLAAALAIAHLPHMEAPTNASMRGISAEATRQAYFRREQLESVAAGKLTPNNMFAVMSCLATYHEQAYPDFAAACEYIATAAVALEFS